MTEEPHVTNDSAGQLHVHRERERNFPEHASPPRATHAADPNILMSISVITPVDVVDAPDLTISEYIGRVAGQHAACSACVATVRAAAEELPQCPAFDEYVLVLEGEVHIRSGPDLADVTIVKAGQGLFLAKNTRVQWAWPGPSKYVPICLPAFSPANCGREESFATNGKKPAKTEESMDRLRRLHAASGSAASLKGVVGSWYGALAVGVLLGFVGARALR